MPSDHGHRDQEPQRDQGLPAADGDQGADPDGVGGDGGLQGFGPVR